MILFGSPRARRLASRRQGQGGRPDLSGEPEKCQVGPSLESWKCAWVENFKDQGTEIPNLRRENYA